MAISKYWHHLPAMITMMLLNIQWIIRIFILIKNLFILLYISPKNNIYCYLFFIVSLTNGSVNVDWQVSSRLSVNIGQQVTSLRGVWFVLGTHGCGDAVLVSILHQTNSITSSRPSPSYQYSDACVSSWNVVAAAEEKLKYLSQ